MKKYLMFALTLVLTAAMFTACGCTSQDAKYTTAPTTMPTIMTTVPTTEATRPTTEATMPTADHGNGPLENTTGNTTTATETTEPSAQSRARQMQPTVR